MRAHFSEFAQVFAAKLFALAHAKEVPSRCYVVR